MAVAYQSTSTTAWGERGTISITHPSGLTAGDLMIATIATNSDIMSTPSGWTALVTGGITPYDFAIYYKIATSGDVSAGSTSWTGGSTEDKWGNISRYTGHNITTPIDVYASGDYGAGATPSIAASITPTIANTLLVQFWTGRKTGASTISASGYAVANNNPTWTEIVDAPRNDIGGSGNSVGIGIAYGDYSPTTATGNSSLTWSASFDSSIVFILAIKMQTTDYPITISAGSYTYTGNTINLLRAIKMVASLGTYTYTGIATILKRGYGLVASLGTYTYAGIATGLRSTRSIIASLGTYTYSGFATGLWGGFGIIASLGTYTYTGVNASITSTRKIIISAGAYTYSGINIILQKSYNLIVSSGSYIYTGFSAVVKRLGWRNETKNSSTWANNSKNSSNWINENKN